MQNKFPIKQLIKVRSIVDAGSLKTNVKKKKVEMNQLTCTKQQILRHLANRFGGQRYVRFSTSLPNGIQCAGTVL